MVSFWAMAATPAVGGIADSPLPVLQAGVNTLHLYSVPGVINDGAGLGTFFSCTSTSTGSMRVGVELFGAGGGAPINDAAATALTVAAGATVLFATSNAAGFPENSLLAGGNFAQGSARILATSKSLVCTAYLADELNSPPASMSYLTIIAKTKQKAAN